MTQTELSRTGGLTRQKKILHKKLNAWLNSTVALWFLYLNSTRLFKLNKKTNKTLDGTKTSQEDVADQGGLKLAYRVRRLAYECLLGL